DASPAPCGTARLARPPRGDCPAQRSFCEQLYAACKQDDATGSASAPKWRISAFWGRRLRWPEASPFRATWPLPPFRLLPKDYLDDPAVSTRNFALNSPTHTHRSKEESSHAPPHSLAPRCLRPRRWRHA